MSRTHIITQGKSIGGSDDIHKLDEEGTLKGILEAGGITVGGA